MEPPGNSTEKANTIDSNSFLRTEVIQISFHNGYFFTLLQDLKHACGEEGKHQAPHRFPEITGAVSSLEEKFSSK